MDACFQQLHLQVQGTHVSSSIIRRLLDGFNNDILHIIQPLDLVHFSPGRYEGIKSGRRDLLELLDGRLIPAAHLLGFQALTNSLAENADRLQEDKDLQHEVLPEGCVP